MILQTVNKKKIFRKKGKKFIKINNEQKQRKNLKKKKRKN